MNNRKALAKKLLQFSGLLILTFFCLEIGTRLFWRDTTSGEARNMPLQQAEQKMHYRTNSLGIRNKEISRDKPAGVLRLLAIGDSFVYGYGLPEEALVTVKIEQALNEKLARPVEVINSGIVGFNTTDQYKQLKRLGDIYDPELVIVFFFTDDVLERVKPAGENKPRIQTADWKQNAKEALRNHSRFFAWLYSLYKSKGASKIGVPRVMLPSDYFNLDDSKPGWVAFKKGVHEMQDYVQDNHMRFLFVMIPTLTTLNKNYPYMELRQKVTAFIQSNDIPFIDLFDTLAPYPPGELWVSQQNNHWNAHATTLAADEIVRMILYFGLLKP